VIGHYQQRSRTRHIAPTLNPELGKHQDYKASKKNF
jgi:hypothetical protein